MENIYKFLCFLFFITEICSEEIVTDVRKKLENLKVDPLDPISVEEAQLAVKIVEEYSPTGTPTIWSFNTVYLKEPSKEILELYFSPDHIVPIVIPRRAYFVVRSNNTGEYFEGIVNLDASSIESFNQLKPNDLPKYTEDEATIAIGIARNDPEVQKRSKDLGYEDMSLVFPSLWSIGYTADKPYLAGKRIGQVIIFGLNFHGDNPYAHPFPFLLIVDLLLHQVVEFRDFPIHNDGDTKNRTGENIPTITYNFDQDFRSQKLREHSPSPPPSPLNAFKVNNYHIKWQHFRMNIGFNQREGLIIYRVSILDEGKDRPIAHRISMSEMFVPYGDPRFPLDLKTVFDEGEYGLGTPVMELVEGEDCPTSSHFWDGVVTDDAGVVIVKKNAICAYEEDAGILWKHQDEASEKTAIARSRRFVLYTAVRLGNYEYLFYWYFYQDASIQFEVKLSGVLMTTSIATGASPAYGTRMSPNIIAPFHQHLLGVRLDMDIDGKANSVDSIDMVAVPEESGTPENPYGVGIMAEHKLMKTASEGRDHISPLTSRVWRIFNSETEDPDTGTVASFILKPANTQPIIVKKESPIWKRAEFCSYDFWVTKYNDTQIFAGGEHLNGNDLPAWVEADLEAPITDTDVVIWHIFGVTHNPRREDWPLMPVENIGFWLKPVNFFKENPSLDVPNLHKNDGKAEL